MAYPSHPSSLGVSPLLLTFVACLGILWMANSGEALSCFNCEYTECSSKPLKCPYGITKDVCGCCDVCANGVGQECGGESGILGRCGKGLRCDRRPRGNEALPVEMTEGICVQDTSLPPPRRGNAVPTKWKKLGEDCGGRRAVLGKCKMGLRCDRSPRGNAATPITQRKGVCVPISTNEERRTKAQRRGGSSPRSDRLKSDTHEDKKSRTTPSPQRAKKEKDNHLNALYTPEEAPPLWFVRASWLQRRREAVDRDRKETARAREAEGGAGRRDEKARKKEIGTTQESEETDRKLHYF